MNFLTKNEIEQRETIIHELQLKNYVNDFCGRLKNYIMNFVLDCEQEHELIGISVEFQNERFQVAVFDVCHHVKKQVTLNFEETVAFIKNL